jgi:polysaccharide pyruvyl transferase WcaK-like protein
MKTLLIGNFGAKNIGDELILASALEDYPESFVMTNNETYSQKFTETEFATVPFVPTGMRSFFRFLYSSKYRTRIFQLNKKCSQVIFPGGGLFAIRFRACFLWFLVFLWIRFLFPKNKIVLQHQGIDCHLGFLSRRLTRWALKQANSITVRDESSRKAVKKYIGKDVANIGDRVQKYLKKKTFSPVIQKEKWILINAKKNWNYWDIENKFPVRKKIFVGFDSNDMNYAPNELKKNAIFPQTKTELIDIFQKSEFVIGMRFHSLLLGTFFCSDDKTFLLGKPYSEKVENLAREHHLHHIS